MENETVNFTPTDRTVLESYKVLCEGLANYLGDGFEIVLHSLENYDRSVIKIINGYYTGRSEGAPITDLALRMLEDIRNNSGTDYIAYNSKNRKGEPLHSTTIAIRGENERIIGLLCINFYMNTPVYTLMKAFMGIGDNTKALMSENFEESPERLLSTSIAEVKHVVLNDSGVAAIDKNKEIITRLNAKGFFNLKDAVSNCADALGISKNTVYLHLRNLKKDG